MDKDLLAIVQPLLELHEGRKSKPYTDTVGKLTIGIGHNLTDNGITDNVINTLFQQDITIAEVNCITLFGEEVWQGLSLRRKAALLDWCFNLGLNRAATFSNTIVAIKQGKFQNAAQGLRISRWAQQVGDRALRLAYMVEKG